MKKTLPALFAVAVVAMAAGAFYFGGRQTSQLARTNPLPVPEDSAPPLVPPVDRPTRTSKAKTVTIYKIVAEDNDLRLAPLKADVPGGGDAKMAALNAMAALKPEDSPLPPGSQVRKVEMIGDGVAFVDFNAAFKSNFEGGSTQEALTLNAVLATLAQFQGVERVQITVDGKKIDSLGGHLSLKEPLAVPRNADETARTARGDEP